MRHLSNTEAQRLLDAIQRALSRRDGATVAQVVAAISDDDSDRICFPASNGKIWPLELRIHRSSAALLVYEVSQDGRLLAASHVFDIERHYGSVDAGHVGTLLDGLLSHMAPVLDELCTLGPARE